MPRTLALQTCYALLFRQPCVHWRSKWQCGIQTRRFLNRILFDSDEVENLDSSQPSNVPTVTLSADDYRSLHTAKILGLRNNDTIRAGIVSSSGGNGQITDNATIEWLPQGKVKKAEPFAKSGKPPGLLRVHLPSLKEVEQGEEAAPSVSLILALPRPLQLNRMIPMISQMGIQHLVLTGAHKVPKDYFGSHLFRKPHQLRDKLVEGLCQAGDVQLPELHICKHLNTLSDGKTEDGPLLDRLFPLDKYARVVAHPLRAGIDDESPIRMDRVKFPPQSPTRKIVVAIGPEGGWLEPKELDWFTHEHGFQHVTLGTRVLRSDCAVVSLLALAHFVCSAEPTQQLRD